MTVPLWQSSSVREWSRALNSYDEVIAAQGVASLRDHDDWYRNELPALMEARKPPYITLVELVRVTRWKMSRGRWRARNLQLVQGNDPAGVLHASRDALGALEHPTRPISILSTLAGVGPATASAVVAAVAPDRFPFFEDLVAEQIPGLGKVAYTLGYYTRFSAALRDRAGKLGGNWTAESVGRAIWAHCGGKAASGS